MSHCYGGVEHTQEGPFPECLLCRIDAIESAARAYVENVYPGLLRGKRDPNHPLLSALAEALRAADSQPEEEPT